MTTDWLRVDDINVGARLRQDLGDIAGLAKSIDEYGLLHPLVIDADNNLIAGGRRLEAMKSLGWTKVEVRQFEEMSADERRVLELEENLRRKDLTSYERSRNLTDLATAAETVDRQTGEITRSNSEQVSSKRGPEQEPGSIRRVSERINVPTTSIHRAQQHVAAAESFPVLQQPQWKQYQAMEAAELLRTIPEDEQPAIVALIDQPGIPPRDAIEVIRNVSQKSEPERKHIASLAASTDDRDRSLALTKAAEFPPMPDGRSIALRAVVRDLRKCIKAYPSDPEVEELEGIVSRVEAVIRTIDERHKSRVETAA